MARFYQTAQRNYEDDFMYKPPWEMLMQAAAKKDNEISTNLDQMELIRDLPIDRLDYHREAVQNIQNEIGTQVDDLARSLSQNQLDTNNKYAIRKLRKNIQDRINNGDIYNIQQSAINYRKFEQELKDNKNITEADKAKYKDYYWNQYVNSNPNGGYNSVFNAGPMLESMNYLDQFAEWWDKYGGTDSFSQVADKVNGQWILKETNGHTNKIVGENFKKFIESNTNIKDNMNHRQQVFGERYFDENGALLWNDESSLLNKQNELAQAMDKKSITKGDERRVNDIWLTDHKHAQAVQLATLRKASGGDDPTRPAVGVLANKLLDVNTGLQAKLVSSVMPIMMQYRDKYQKQFGQQLEGLPPSERHKYIGKMNNGLDYLDDMTVPDAYEFITEVMNDGGKMYGGLYAEVKPYYEAINKNMRASNEIVASKLGYAETSALLNDINNQTTRNDTFFIGLEEGSTTSTGVTGGTTKGRQKLQDIDSINGVPIIQNQTKILPNHTVLVPTGDPTTANDMVMMMVSFTEKATLDEDDKPVPGRTFTVPVYKPLSEYQLVPSRAGYDEQTFRAKQEALERELDSADKLLVK